MGIPYLRFNQLGDETDGVPNFAELARVVLTRY